MWPGGAPPRARPELQGWPSQHRLAELLALGSSMGKAAMVDESGCSTSGLSVVDGLRKGGITAAALSLAACAMRVGTDASAAGNWRALWPDAPRSGGAARPMSWCVQTGARFAMYLTRELRKLGLEYLACEAFNGNTDPNTGVLNRRSSVMGDSVFAEFQRAARREGWKLVAYDHMSRDAGLLPHDQTRWRKQQQARNLMDRIFAPDPQAKVFIYRSLEIP